MTHRLFSRCLVISSLLGLCACSSFEVVCADEDGSQDTACQIDEQGADDTIDDESEDGAGGSSTDASGSGAAGASAPNGTGSGHGGSGNGANETGSSNGGAGNGGAGDGSSGEGGSSDNGSGGAGGADPLAESCADAAPNVDTGQKCPLFSPCGSHDDCGVDQGCQLWYCSADKTCQLETVDGCGEAMSESCQDDIVVTQEYAPPVEKDFLAPDGIDQRDVGSIAFEITNNSTRILYLSQVAFEVQTQGFASKFDVETIKIFKNQGGADFLPEEDTILVCSTFKPFSSPANGTVSGCNAGDAVSIAPGGTERFVAVLVFNEDDVFIANRSYRLRIASNDGLELSTKYPTTATSVYTGESCGIPAAGFDGAWVHAKEL